MDIIFQDEIILLLLTFSGTLIKSSYCKILDSFPLEFMYMRIIQLRCKCIKTSSDQYLGGVCQTQNYRGKVSLLYDKCIVQGKVYTLVNIRELPLNLGPTISCV